MTERRRQQSRSDGINVIDGSRDGQCLCCSPKNPLVMRPDFGVLADGSPEWALCVLHEPQPTVYRNRGDGIFLQMPGYQLSAAGELLDGQRRVVASVAGDGFQRLSTLDDEDGSAAPQGPAAGSNNDSPAGDDSTNVSDDRDHGSRPQTHHVDLSEDDFYTDAYRNESHTTL